MPFSLGFSKSRKRRQSNPNLAIFFCENRQIAGLQITFLLHGIFVLVVVFVRTILRSSAFVQFCSDFHSNSKSSNFASCNLCWIYNLNLDESRCYIIALVESLGKFGSAQCNLSCKQAYLSTILFGKRNVLRSCSRWLKRQHKLNSVKWTLNMLTEWFLVITSRTIDKNLCTWAIDSVLSNHWL